MTGFRGLTGGNGGDYSNQVTPIQDKNSILGSKPFLGVKKNFGKSPNNAEKHVNQTPHTNMSGNLSEMRLQFGA